MKPAPILRRLTLKTRPSGGNSLRIWPARLKTLGVVSKNNFATEATLETKPYKLHKLEQSPATTVSLTREDAIKYYTQLHTVRRMETTAGNLYKDKIVRGFCHLYSGQVPLGVGIAYALKYKGTDGVCVALYGDGASNQGQVFEVYNMAKLWNIPCIFVCENNGYGMGTSAERSSASTAYYSRGDYVPGIWVDGMDVLAVRECFRYAIDYCGSGKGPLVIEAATYRYSGHSMSDPGTSYRTRDEIQEVRQTRDPITSFKEKITSANLVSADEIKKIDADIRATVDEATKQAKADKEIGLDELSADIYAHNLEEKIRNVSLFTPLVHKRIGPAVNMN
ncbi:hypothetical protein NQ318_002378 [Aromia moschata]|uniref:Dehydrogenase E1 component domain-containing protein n=1 Tax=Aromia moschata TaxID=1265417 RepID=A0AAV8YG60_9CUCU|nr:hypothetical protein NQ318_002378 [Aromia moschata]